MLLACAREAFCELPKTEQDQYLRNLGRWYMKNKEIPEAIETFYRAGDYDSMLGALETTQSGPPEAFHRKLPIKTPPVPR